MPTALAVVRVELEPGLLLGQLSFRQSYIRPGLKLGGVRPFVDRGEHGVGFDLGAIIDGLAGVAGTRHRLLITPATCAPTSITSVGSIVPVARTVRAGPPSASAEKLRIGNIKSVSVQTTPPAR